MQNSTAKSVAVHVRGAVDVISVKVRVSELQFYKLGKYIERNIRVIISVAQKFVL